MQRQLHEVENRRNDLVPEHQRVQKRLQKIQKHLRQEEIFTEIQHGGKRRNARNQREEMREIRAEVVWKAERFTLLSDEVDKIQWQMQWKQNFRDC